MQSKLIKTIATGIVILGLGFGGLYVYNNYFSSKTVVSTTQFFSVSTKKMDLQLSVQGTGAAYAATTKDVSPNNNGTLQDLNVEVGDTVTAGQKLFVSDSDELSKNVATAKNNLAKQKLTLVSDQNAEKLDANKIAMDKLSVSDAKVQLNDAYEQLNKAAVTAPISGVVTAVNNNNGDKLQAGQAVLTIVNKASIKVKLSVDELDIEKIKTGQKATIKFDAIKNKTYEGTVAAIAQTGTTSNNVTTYDVVVGIKKPIGIKLGMNANVTILVNSKKNALVIPAEALVEKSGKKYVRVASANGNNGGTNEVNNSQQNDLNNSNLVAIKTGLETENYIEITSGLTDGQSVLVQLPQSSSTNNNKNRFSGGFGPDMGGGFGGPMGGPPQGGNNSGSKNN